MASLCSEVGQCDSGWKYHNRNVWLEATKGAIITLSTYLYICIRCWRREMEEMEGLERQWEKNGEFSVYGFFSDFGFLD